MEILTIDRFEGDIAVCEREDCSMTDVPLDRLPKGVRVGNVLVVADDGTIKIDAQEELRRKREVFRVFDSLFKKNVDEA